jgi:hypothetical protein
MPQQQIEMEEAIRENNYKQETAINLAAANRDTGMALATEHAKDHHKDWDVDALYWLTEFLFTRSTPFMAEEVREYAKHHGLADAPNQRAWGSILVKAKKLGLIKFVGYAQTTNPLAHRTPAALWVRA